MKPKEEHFIGFGVKCILRTFRDTSIPGCPRICISVDSVRGNSLANITISPETYYNGCCQLGVKYCDLTASRLKKFTSDVNVLSLVGMFKCVPELTAKEKQRILSTLLESALRMRYQYR